jgi:hypothetical protein
MKTGSKSGKFITKMISAESSTNPESFIGFGLSRRMELSTSHGYTHMTIYFSLSSNLFEQISREYHDLIFAHFH